MEPANTNLELAGEGAEAMPVNLTHLDACRTEATDFLQKVDAAAARIRADDASIAGTREAAAVISSSIELTRVIADLRRLR